MHTIRDIPKGKLRDDTFLFLSNVILAEIYIPLFRSRRDEDSLRKLCDSHKTTATELIKRSIDEFGKFSLAHNGTFDICQFCLRFLAITLSLENFRVITLDRIPTFRRTSLPRKAIFTIFDELNPGFPPIDVPNHHLKSELSSEIWQILIENLGNLCRRRLKTSETIGYHYTSVDTLFNILRGNSLWLTEINKLNDMDEFQRSHTDLRKKLDANYSGFPKARLLGQLFKYLQDPPLSELASSVFVFSMTHEPESSSQWQNYGQNGTGVCIGFDTSLFLNPDHNFFLFDIMYNMTDGDLSHHIMEYIIFEAIHASQVIFEEANAESSFSDIKPNIGTLLSIILSSYKNSAFLNENEMRMCVIAPRPDSIKVRRGIYGESKYVEQTFRTSSGMTFLPITHVVLGNKVSSEENIRIRETMSKTQYQHVKISESTTRLR